MFGEVIEAHAFQMSVHHKKLTPYCTLVYHMSSPDVSKMLLADSNIQIARTHGLTEAQELTS